MAQPNAVLPPVSLEQLGAIFDTALAGLATQAQLATTVAPLATQAQLANAVAPLVTQAQLANAVAPLATQAQLDAMLVRIQALLQPLNVPAFVAAATTTVQSIGASRMQNAHDRSDVEYAVVQRTDGTPPPHWPVGFDRNALIDGPIAVVDTLLNDFGLPHGAPVSARQRRNALALHIGTTRV